MVLGSGGARCASAGDHGARVLVHPGRADGMASSLVAALATLQDDCEAAVWCSATARLSSEAVQRVASRIAVGDAPLAGGRYASGRPHPVAIDSFAGVDCCHGQGINLGARSGSLRRRGLPRPRISR